MFAYKDWSGYIAGIVATKANFQTIAVAVAANAGAFNVPGFGAYNVEITGALTGAGVITPSVTAGVTMSMFDIDNATTGNFLLTMSGLPVPLGRSSWYWNGAAFEMVSSQSFTTLPLAFAANAASLVIAANSQYNVELTGALTGTGVITPTLGSGVSDVLVNFDNATTGGFTVTVSGLTVPPGRSTWYYNGTTFEMVSARGFTTAQVTPIPAVGVSITASHLCGAAPLHFRLEFICLTAEQGYNVGDIIIINEVWSGANIYPLDMAKDSSTVYALLPAALDFAARNKTTPATTFTPTKANWAYRFAIQP